MSLNDGEDYITFELIYKSTTNNSKIKLFGSEFVKKNKDKCKIIYNGKEYDLMEYFTIDKNYNHNDSILLI